MAALAATGSNAEPTQHLGTSLGRRPDRAGQLICGEPAAVAPGQTVDLLGGPTLGCPAAQQVPAGRGGEPVQRTTIGQGASSSRSPARGPVCGAYGPSLDSGLRR